MIELDRQRTALLLLDFQNYTVDPAGYWAVRVPAWADQLASSDVIARTAGLVGVARAAGLSVVHVGTAWRPGSPDMNVSGPGYASYRDRSVEGTWGAEFCEPLRPLPGETVIWKRGISALSGTELDRLLRLLDVRTLVLAGVVTNFAVAATAFEAFDRGYRVIVVADCCTALTDVEHEHALGLVLSQLATIVESAHLADTLAMPGSPA